MLQHYISTSMLYIGINLIILGLIISLSLSLVGLILVGISPYIQNKEYEYKKWEKEYLSN